MPPYIAFIICSLCIGVLIHQTIWLYFSIKEINRRHQDALSELDTKYLFKDVPPRYLVHVSDTLKNSRFTTYKKWFDKHRKMNYFFVMAQDTRHDTDSRFARLWPSSEMVALTDKEVFECELRGAINTDDPKVLLPLIRNGVLRMNPVLVKFITEKSKQSS
jgi:hypothetical protein